MQLKIQRSQRVGGISGGTVYFCLDVRADYAPEERDNIRKYRLGGEVIYNSQAAKRHLENAGAHLDRVDSDRLRDKAAGLARGSLSMVMAKMSLNITIASLGKGHHIECKDLNELMEAEQTVRDACKGVTGYLDTAATFDGSEVVIEYDKGEERVHITQSAPPLLSYEGADAAGRGGSSQASGEVYEFVDPAQQFGRSLGHAWSSSKEFRIISYVVGALVLVIFLMRIF